MNANDPPNTPGPATPAPLPDDTLELTGHHGATIARAALWWSQTPELDGAKTGAIGQFHATDAASARQLLAAAETRLRAVGARLAIGPMDGNTWRRYRWVVASDGREPFLLEPWNPPEYPHWWKAAGFTAIAGYSSSVADTRHPAANADEVRRRFEEEGFAIRPMDASRITDELRAIHALSLRSFTGNFLYTPMEAGAFEADYGKVATALDPECVLFAERDGRCVAFLFGIPDLAACQRGESPALIAKTIAVLPEYRRHGIGTVLLDELQAIALRKGYHEIIHALQYQQNNTRKITARLAHRVFRRYELLAKML